MILSVLLVFVAVTAVMTFVLQLIGSTIYDARAIRYERQLSKSIEEDQLTPLVTVVIVTHNDGAAVVACLASIGDSSYPSVQTLVVDRASTDNTKQVVRDYIRAHPAHSVRLMARRDVSTTPVALGAAYTAHIKGELVLLLDPRHIVMPTTIMRSVRYFIRPEIEVVRAQLQTRLSHNLAGLVGRYLEILGQSAQKLATISHAKRTLDSASMYRRTTFKSQLRVTRPISYMCDYYADDVVITTPANSSTLSLIRQIHRQQLRHWQATLEGSRPKVGTVPRVALNTAQGLALLLTPLLMAYLVYIAVVLLQPQMLLIVLSAVGLLMVTVIWGCKEVKFPQKLLYTLGIPLLAIPFLLLSLSQLWFVARLDSLRPQQQHYKAT